MGDFAQGQGKIRFYTGGIHEVCRGLKSYFDTEIGENSHFWTEIKCRCSKKPNTVFARRSADAVSDGLNTGSRRFAYDFYENGYNEIHGNSGKSRK